MELNEQKLKKFGKKFRVSEVCAFLGITPRILKHYEDTGILQPDRTDNNDYREYSAEDVIKVQLAERLKKMQLSQREIGEYFAGTLDIEKKRAELIRLREMIDNIIAVLDVDRRNGAPQFSIEPEQSLLCYCKTYPSTTNFMQQYFNSRDAYTSAIAAGCVCDVAHSFIKRYDNLVSFNRIDDYEEKLDNQTYLVCVPIISPPKAASFDGTVQTVTIKKSLVMAFAIGGEPLTGESILKSDGKYRGAGFYLQEEAGRRGIKLSGKSWMLSETGPHKKTTNRTYTTIIGAEIK